MPTLICNCNVHQWEVTVANRAEAEAYMLKATEKGAWHELPNNEACYHAPAPSLIWWGKYKP